MLHVLAREVPSYSSQYDCHRRCACALNDGREGNLGT